MLMKALFLSDKPRQHSCFGAQSCPPLKGGSLYRDDWSNPKWVSQAHLGGADGIGRLGACLGTRCDSRLLGNFNHTEPSCSLTLYVVTFNVGITVKEPVRTSNFHPCHGQVTTEPLRFPSPRGPPRCKQTFAKAKYSFLTRNRAMLLPSTLTTLLNPSLRSLFSATFTNLVNL